MANRDRNSHKRGKSIRTSIALGLALVLAALVTPLASCGGASENVTTKPPPAILAASANAARQASGVHVLSTLMFGKEHASLELQLAGQNGGRARSTLGDVRSEVLRIGETLYVEVDPAISRRLAKTTGVRIPPGSWLKAPANDAQFAESALLTQPGGELVFLLRNPTLSLTKGPITTLRGQKAIELKTKGKLYTGAIYVTATGTPYPLEIVKRGRENSRTTFTDWNDPVALAPPANAIDITRLEHQ